MAIRTADAIRETLGGRLGEAGFRLKGKWPIWTWERQADGLTDKVRLWSETAAKGSATSARRMNVNFSVQHPQAGTDIWMNRPGEEWFEYGDEPQLRRELLSCLSRIVDEVLPWMERRRSE